MEHQKVLNLLIILLIALACKQEPPTDPISGGGSQNPTNPTNPTDPSDPIDPVDPDPDPPSTNLSSYTPLGVGGGGAMSGVAISPYANLWFVGTDMGTLFRSADLGASWQPINHYQADFSSHLPDAVSPGFSSDGTTIFHAAGGDDPIRSIDSGITFSRMTMGLQSNEKVVYWSEDTQNANVIFAGTNKGLLISQNKGLTWNRTSAFNSKSLGTYIDHYNGQTTIYHATESKIQSSTNLGVSFTDFYVPTGHKIRMFTGGRDNQGLTLAYGDNKGNEACTWAMAYLNDWGQSAINDTLDTCGFVWVKKNTDSFSKLNQSVGDHLKMAENDSQTIYATWGKSWIRQYGTKVFVTENAGSSWDLRLNQINWDVIPFQAWPENKIEYSAVALDVGWWDSGYESFAINKLNSSVVAGSGYFFLHSSTNKGNYWNAPFTQYEDVGAPTWGKKWKTQGIEVISIYKIKIHPNNHQLVYAASADIGGMVSEDGGSTFRLCKAAFNSNYDYAFNPSNDLIVYAASGNEHDYPEGWHANSNVSDGGIYRSNDRGHNWTRLTPSNNGWARQFLSVGYDASRTTIYGGSQGDGIARSTNNGQTWSWFNSGLPAGDKIISQIEVDPANGNVYALLTGDAPNWTNRAKTGIYFLDVQNGSTTWSLLRGNVVYPPEADSGYQTWWYPTGFAVDFSDPLRNTLWLVDYENKGNWLMTGAWKSTDRGQNWNRKIQFTHPTAINLDPENANNVFVSGQHYLDNSWGNGGQIFSTDGGTTWKKNMTPSLQHNGRNAYVDPTNPNNIYYTYFGGGILKGPNPTRQPASVEVENVTN